MTSFKTWGERDKLGIYPVLTHGKHLMTTKGHHHYSYGGDIKPRDVRIYQPFDLTLLKKSNLRAHDELQPRPEKAIWSNYTMQHHMKQENPYSSHRSRFEVFPDPFKRIETIEDSKNADCLISGSTAFHRNSLSNQRLETATRRFIGEQDCLDEKLAPNEDCSKQNSGLVVDQENDSHQKHSTHQLNNNFNELDFFKNSNEDDKFRTESLTQNQIDQQISKLDDKQRFLPPIHHPDKLNANTFFSRQSVISNFHNMCPSKTPALFTRGGRRPADWHLRVANHTVGR